MLKLAFYHMDRDSLVKLVIVSQVVFDCSLGFRIGSSIQVHFGE